MDDFLGRHAAKGLYLFLNLRVYFLSGHIHKGSQMGQADALPAVLVAGYLGDNLSGDIAGVEKLWGFSILVSLITVPFCSMSSRFTRSQLCMC